MNIKEQEYLKKYTTFKTGGPASFFIDVNSEAGVIEALRFARNKNLSAFILGGGANLLFKDSGFDGVVIRLNNKEVTFNEFPNGKVEVVVDAGMDWDELVALTVEKGLHGLENLSLIPGRVGASPVQNIGAYGVEVKDRISFVETIDKRDFSKKVFSPRECEFSYRNSFFKTPEGKNYVVTKVGFMLEIKGSLNIEYKDIKEYFETTGKNVDLINVRKAIIEVRNKKLPDHKVFGTAGSFFKNPIIDIDLYHELLKKYPGIPAHKESEGFVKIPLGFIIDKICGMRGYKDGKVSTHKDQALVIVSEGAKASEIIGFANKISEAVFSKTGIKIEREVEII